MASDTGFGHHPPLRPAPTTPRAYSLTGEPAASRIERFLDARELQAQGRAGLDPEDITAVANRATDHELLTLTVSDLRAVLAELHDYQTGVKAVLAHGPAMARNVYSGGYRDALTDVRNLLAQHIPDMADDGR